jgi:hypothetical protein
LRIVGKAFINQIIFGEKIRSDLRSPNELGSASSYPRPPRDRHVHCSVGDMAEFIAEILRAFRGPPNPAVRETFQKADHSAAQPREYAAPLMIP